MLLRSRPFSPLFQYDLGAPRTDPQEGTSCHRASTMRYRFNFVCSFLAQDPIPPTLKCQPRPFTATGVPSFTLLLTMASALAGTKGPTLVDWIIISSDGLISRRESSGRRLAPCQESIRKSSPRAFALPYVVFRMPAVCCCPRESSLACMLAAWHCLLCPRS